MDVSSSISQTADHASAPTAASKASPGTGPETEPTRRNGIGRALSALPEWHIRGRVGVRVGVKGRGYGLVGREVAGAPD